MMALRSPAPLPPRGSVPGSPQRAGGPPGATPGAFSGRISAPARDDALVGRTLKVQKGPFRCDMLLNALGALNPGRSGAQL